jgi:hypothetical protein
MTSEEARALIQKHTGRSSAYAPEQTFLGMLRPYRGLQEAHYLELMQALAALAPSLQGAQVDRELMADLWEIVFLPWLWALSPEGMVQRQKLMTAEDQARLAGWIEEIGLTVSLLLGGEDVPNVPSARRMLAAKPA